ncbi:unnamed protein product [Rhizopus stolonifer]
MSHIMLLRQASLLYSHIHPLSTFLLLLMFPASATPVHPWLLVPANRFAIHSAIATSAQAAISSSSTRYSSIETSTRVAASLSTSHSATAIRVSSSNNSHSAIATNAQNISKVASVTPTPSKSAAPGYKIPYILIYVAALSVCVFFL